MMLKPDRMFAAAFVILFSATAAVAQERGTPEQRAACAPDAFRLCSSYIPDPSGVEACLRQQKARLSSPCRALFDQRAAGAETSRRTSLPEEAVATTTF